MSIFAVVIDEVVSGIGVLVLVVFIVAVIGAIGYATGLIKPPKCKWCGEKDAVHYEDNGDGYCEDHRYEKDRK